MMKKIFALGFFDGVHLGHQVLLAECCRMAKEENMVIPAAVTFDLSPMAVLTGKDPNMLTSLSDRLALLTRYGMEEVKVLDTKTPVLTQNWRVFLENLIAEGAVGFVCGEDFRFGHRGEGTAWILQDYCREKGLACAVVPKQTVDKIPVSSTHIRALVADGQMEQAVKFLGHPHILTGRAVKGRQIGRTMDFPTANLLFSDGVLVPRFGVYACRATVDGKSYNAVTNIGTRPTVSGHGVTAEAHLLDFAGDLYGKELELAFYKFLRPEMKFANLDALKAQIAADIMQAKSLPQGGRC